MKNLLLIECIPKGDTLREGVVLHEFLRMADPDDRDLVQLVEFTDKNRFLTFLENTEKLASFDCIHLSGHGCNSQGELEFKLPRGTVSPEEFPEGCFDRKAIGMSACELGKVSFCHRLAAQTSLKHIIAPQREVPFIDASIWYANFYYLYIKHNTRIANAYAETNNNLKNRVQGAFKHWPYQ